LLDVTEWQKGPPFKGEDSEDSQMLNAMADAAKNYLQSHKWAAPIANMYLAFGIGNVLALFLVRFAKNVNFVHDEELWVVVGDLPSVYFVTDEATNARDALDIYCSLMDDWVDAVRSGKSLKEVFPVRAAATLVNADALAGRLQYIRREILPDI
jgi:hypothetical protein